MSFQALDNFGGIRFGSSSGYIDFTYSTAKIRYSPIFNYSYQTNTGKQVRNLKGYRAVISANVIITTTAESTEMYKFLNEVNASRIVGNTERAITIFPRYDPNMAVNSWFVVFLDSDIAPEDIANISIGQTYALTFTSKELLSSLSTNIDITTQNGTVTDTGDDYNLIVTEDGTDYYLTFNSTKD